ncbi:MAG: hypothetical protein IKJ12_02530 [Rikenellaceae bacterium]|nr:hypothetical protein [Rikenellaceae bacterium]
MERDIMTTELEQMREQITLLRSKLDKEAIVNERLLRRAMHDKVRGITRDNTAMIILGTLAIPYTFLVFDYLGISLWFSIATALLLIVCVVATWWGQRGLHADELLDGDVVSVGKKVLRLKQMNDRWLWFAIPMLILWLAWFYWEAYQQVGGTPLFRGFVTGGVIGLILGLIVGGKVRYRTQRRVREILAHIEELTRE